MKKDVNDRSEQEAYLVHGVIGGSLLNLMDATQDFQGALYALLSLRKLNNARLAAATVQVHIAYEAFLKISRLIDRKEFLQDIKALEISEQTDAIEEIRRIREDLQECCDEIWGQG